MSVPRLTAEVLLAHALHKDRTYLYAHSEDELSEHERIHYGRYLTERLQGRPTQYVTHLQEFYGREYYVDEHVLIPRPETEHMVETALEHIKTHAPQSIVDVGTGSGAIAISIALESGRDVLATDISELALRVAERNRRSYGARVHFAVADFLSPLRERSVDLLVSNPPYVPGDDAAHLQKEVRNWEPAVALFGGESGFDMYRVLIGQAEQVVKPGGRLMMEMGYKSLDRVSQMLTPRWTDLNVVHDLAGWPRLIQATLV